MFLSFYLFFLYPFVYYLVSDWDKLDCVHPLLGLFVCACNFALDRTKRSVLKRLFSCKGRDRCFFFFSRTSVWVAFEG